MPEVRFMRDPHNLTARLERSSADNANMFRLWTKDKERLRHWQFACLILAGFIVVALAGLVMSELR